LERVKYICILYDRTKGFAKEGKKKQKQKHAKIRFIWEKGIELTSYNQVRNRTTRV
jgi:hypothetical protein